MGKKLRQFGLRSKALLFTAVIHGALIAFLFDNSSDTVKPGAAEPMEAWVVSARDLEAEQVVRELEELTRRREEEKKKQEVEEKKKKIEVEKKRKAEQLKKLEAEKKRKAEQLKKKQEVEKKRKAEQLKKKQEAEKKRKAEQLKKKQEAEKKRKAEQLKKQEAEKKRKAEQLKKKQEAEAKRQRAEQLRKRLEQEQRAKNKKDAGTAMSALKGRIAAAVGNNWRRPHTSQSGLTARIRVKVARDGQVLSADVIRSSGDLDFDASAEIAVLKASPLPFPSEPHYYEFINEFDFVFDPDE